MKNMTLFTVCMLVCVGLSLGMSITSKYSHYGWEDSHYGKKDVMPVPVVYKKVDSVLPVLLSVVLSQFFRRTTATTDTDTLRANGITVITENPCC